MSATPWGSRTLTDAGPVRNSAVPSLLELPGAGVSRTVAVPGWDCPWRSRGERRTLVRLRPAAVLRHVCSAATTEAVAREAVLAKPRVYTAYPRKGSAAIGPCTSANSVARSPT
jgi:hypothetical protein